MPHLMKLQEKYSGIEIVGVAA
ncbi:hypothetical protein [Mesorhizobium sp. AR02]|nr:hypothetical protein [Mesorhizobium sp. AR02]